MLAYRHTPSIDVENSFRLSQVYMPLELIILLLGLQPILALDPQDFHTWSVWTRASDTRSHRGFTSLDFAMQGSEHGLGSRDSPPASNTSAKDHSVANVILGVGPNGGLVRPYSPPPRRIIWSIQVNGTGIMRKKRYSLLMHTMKHEMEYGEGHCSRFSLAQVPTQSVKIVTSRRSREKCLQSSKGFNLPTLR